MTRYVILWVERVFDGHRACDAAGVHIAVDGGGIPAAGDLAERDGVDVDAGGVGDDIGRAADARNGREHGVRQLVELAVDRAQVAREHGGARLDLLGDQRELAARRSDRADDHVEVCHRDDVGDVGPRPDDDAAVKIDARRGDGVEVDVHAHIARRVRRLGEIGRDEREAVAELTRAVLRVVHGLFNKAAELVELGGHHGELAGGDFGTDIGLHLAGDAANVLAPADRAAVRAGAHLPAAAPDDAADVVADVLVADGGLVHALADRAGGVARNAAGVGRDAERVELGELGEVERELEAQIAEVDGGVCALDVHIGAVFARNDRAEVIARDAAGHVLAEDSARGLARADDARDGVAARDAADIALAGNRAVEGAAFDRAVVFTRDAAEVLAVARGRESALNAQVFDDAVLLHHAEKTRGRDAILHIKAADGVAAAVKRAAEGGNGQRIGTLEHKVVVEHDLFAARVGVERAGAREGLEIRLGFDVDGIIPVGKRAREGEKG